MALQVNLDWHLLYRALWCSSEKYGSFFFFFWKVELFHSLLSKECFSCLLLMYNPKFHEEKFNISSFLLSQTIHTCFELGKFKTQNCSLFSSQHKYRTGKIMSKFSHKMWHEPAPLFANFLPDMVWFLCKLLVLQIVLQIPERLYCHFQWVCLGK